MSHGFCVEKRFLVETSYCQKYLKQRFRYSAGHPGSYNPAIKEAHMIYGNINKESGEPSQVADVGKKHATQISGEILEKSLQCFFCYINML